MKKIRELLFVVLLICGLVPLSAMAITPTPQCEDTMRTKTDYIVVHCSATKLDQDIGAAEIRAWHTSPPRNWNDIGYHAVIRLDGRIEFGRHFDTQGAQVHGYNDRSLGVCLVGGLDEHGQPACTFNKHQLVSLGFTLSMLRRAYPEATVLGHRDLSPDVDGDGVVERSEWLKECPCLDVAHFLETGDAVFA